MERRKYTEEQFQKAIQLRLKGISKPEISKRLNIKIPSLTKLFRERQVKLSEADKRKLVVGARWKGWEPVKDGKKKCSRCGKYLRLSCFTRQASSKSGLSDACRACASQVYRQNEIEVKEKVRKYRDANLKKIKEKQIEYYEKNKEHIVERVSEWRQNNKKKTREYTKKYQSKNKKLKVERTARYRASRISATPNWLSEEQKNELKMFYKNCPEKHHVDHITPLRSPIVCGLHVPWNLQYLPDQVNESKGSIFFDAGSVGVCHQFKRKIETEEEDRDMGMPFGCEISDLHFLREELSDEHRDFIKRYEWLGTMGYLIRPEIYVARHYTNHLAGIVVIDQPNAFTSGIEKSHEALIHRGATASWAPPNLGSKLVTYACRESARHTQRRVFMAYSDPEAGEIGTIYQACNFRYLGNRFGARTNIVLENGKTVSPRYFSKTSTYKRYCKELGIVWQKDWQKSNGYKDLSKIPSEVLRILKKYAAEEMEKGEVFYKPPKGKYALIVGKDRRETLALSKKYEDILPSLPYPKRKNKTT